MKMKKRCHGGQRRSYRREGSSLFLSLRKEIHGRASAGASQRDAKGGPQHLGSRFRVAHPPRALYLTWSALKNSPGSLFTKYYYVCQILGPSKNGSCLILLLSTSLSVPREHLVQSFRLGHAVLCQCMFCLSKPLFPLCGI